MNEITLFAPAKINLCLSVLSRRSDGYHEVAMLMQMIGLSDEVRVALHGNDITVSCDDSAVPPGQKNIAHDAAKRFFAYSRMNSGVSIDIQKRIPVAAGLGGGSSDAAAVLAACNKLFDAGLSREQLAEIGAEIGMDVPFFLHGPSALARGRGEKIVNVAPPPPFWVLLVNPGIHVSTASVYQNLNLGLTKQVDCNKIQRLTVNNILDVLSNDLETVTEAKYPVIGQCKTELTSAGARGVLMSGSGPTVFGIFDTETACHAAAEQLAPQGWRLYTAMTLTESPIAGYTDDQRKQHGTVFRH